MILLLNPLLSNISDAATDEIIIDKYLISQNGTYFDIIYKRYSAKVYAKCISMLKNESQAQDAVQDIFIRVITKLSAFNNRSKFSTWLYAVTYNHCIDFIRRNRKYKVEEMPEDLNIEFEEDHIADKLLLETKIIHLKKVLDEIPVKDKSILLMKYQDGMSIKDLSNIMDKSESAVKMQIKRAKEKFLSTKNELFPETV